MDNLGKMYVDSLRKKYEAEMSEAKANLALYLTNLVAIGEHSDLMDEQDKWVTKYTDAKDKLESLTIIVSEINDDLNANYIKG